MLVLNRSFHGFFEGFKFDIRTSLIVAKDVAIKNKTQQYIWVSEVDEREKV